mmetsp:Transcript_16111/g.38438  ORF Transcript_16111/g.38438 Transcript_16111/m.38438 type:complete len:418 (-) Transcript_16111:351-1604(-)
MGATRSWLRSVAKLSARTLGEASAGITRRGPLDEYRPRTPLCTSLAGPAESVMGLELANELGLGVPPGGGEPWVRRAVTAAVPRAMARSVVNRAILLRGPGCPLPWSSMANPGDATSSRGGDVACLDRAMRAMDDVAPVATTRRARELELALRTLEAAPTGTKGVDGGWPRSERFCAATAGDTTAPPTDTTSMGSDVAGRVDARSAISSSPWCDERRERSFPVRYSVAGETSESEPIGGLRRAAASRRRSPPPISDEIFGTSLPGGEGSRSGTPGRLGGGERDAERESKSARSSPAECRATSANALSTVALSTASLPPPGRMEVLAFRLGALGFSRGVPLLGALAFSAETRRSWLVHLTASSGAGEAGESKVVAMARGVPDTDLFSRLASVTAAATALCAAMSALVVRWNLSHSVSL